ncbi:phage baseplate assembly protein V [Escherichia coli]|nr:phage baseplate assembly protein V [Escherichia coli]
MNAQLTEIMRLITNLIRTGVVTEVDRENWLCRVKTGELETNWISWLTLRAGNARTWWRPSEGEQVVLLSLGGNLETAFALPAVYSNQFAPPSTSADACVTEHPDGGWFEYEPTTGRWYLVGTDENVLVLNRTYANRSNAERAAKMQWERLQRGVASFSLQLAEGRADLYTEMPVKVSGFKQPIDDAEWTITTLTHTVSPDNGFTTSIELEVKIGDLEME